MLSLYIQLYHPGRNSSCLIQGGNLSISVNTQPQVFFSSIIYPEYIISVHLPPTIKLGILRQAHREPTYKFIHVNLGSQAVQTQAGAGSWICLTGTDGWLAQKGCCCQWIQGRDPFLFSLISLQCVALLTLCQVWQVAWIQSNSSTRQRPILFLVPFNVYMHPATEWTGFQSRWYTDGTELYISFPMYEFFVITEVSECLDMVHCLAFLEYWQYLQ